LAKCCRLCKYARDTCTHTSSLFCMYVCVYVYVNVYICVYICVHTRLFRKSLFVHTSLSVQSSLFMHKTVFCSCVFLVSGKEHVRKLYIPLFCRSIFIYIDLFSYINRSLSIYLSDAGREARETGIHMPFL